MNQYFFQTWLESAETLVLDVIHAQRLDKLASVLRPLLHGLSHVFQVMVKLRQLF